MTNTSKPILFFGTEQFSLYSLEALVAAGFPIHAVITKPDSRSGRGHAIRESVVKQYALAHDIAVWQPHKLSEIADALAELDAPIGVLVSYGKIIPQSIIDLFSPGIINLHPSLLPRYRGPSPIESAIINRDAETAISIMQLEAGMDSGPVYFQELYPLNRTETQPQLAEALGMLGARRLVELLPAIIEGEMSPHVQNDTAATYCHLLEKSDAHLDPDTSTAEAAEAKVRAHLAFPKTKYTIDGHPIIITKAHVTDTKKTPLDLVCRDGTVLSIDEVTAPSGKTMNAESFLRGYAA